MKDRMFRKILFDCHQATLLSIKRDERSLTFREWLTLQYHLLHCNLCRRFVTQSRTIDKALGAVRKDVEKNPPFRLSDQAKASIREQIKSL